MKALMLFVALIVGMFLSTQAQTYYVTKTATLKVAGAASDTLVASATKSYVFKVTNPSLMTGQIGLTTTATSGTPAYTALLQYSMDGTNWTNLDTITHTGGGGKSAAFSSFSTTFVYYRVTITATSATQKSAITIYTAWRRS